MVLNKGPNFCPSKQQNLALGSFSRVVMALKSRIQERGQGISFHDVGCPFAYVLLLLDNE